MAEAKKPRTRRTKTVQKDDLVEMAAAKAADVESTIAATPALPPPATSPVAGPELFTSVRAQSEALRKAMGEAVAASAQGALEVNDKIIEAVNVQRQTALAIWQTAMTASDLQQALHKQADATRQAYETASTQWKDIAETTARWMKKSFEPLQSALHRPHH